MSASSKFKDKIKEVTKWRGLHSIEYVLLGKSIKVFVIVSLLFSYVFITFPVALYWAQIKLYRLQDISRLESILRDAQSADNTVYAEKWIRARPMGDSREIFNIIDPYTSIMSPAFFINLAMRADFLGDREQKIFWSSLFRYRLQYDALRCANPDAAEIVDKYAGNAWKRLLFNPATAEESIVVTRQVLKYDETYPARNNPEAICEIVSKGNKIASEDIELQYSMVDVENWDVVRQGLHTKTLFELDKAEKELKKTVQK